jgi:hypothetical protein
MKLLLPVDIVGSGFIQRAVINITTQRRIPINKPVEIPACPQQPPKVRRLHKPEDIVQDLGRQLRDMLYHRISRRHFPSQSLKPQKPRVQTNALNIPQSSKPAYQSTSPFIN